jgi:hypothetical protein
LAVQNPSANTSKGSANINDLHFLFIEKALTKSKIPI